MAKALTLTPGVTKAAGSVLRMLDELHQEGRCALKRVDRVEGPACAQVRLTCGSKDFIVSFTAQAEPPHLIGGLGVKEPR